MRRRRKENVKVKETNVCEHEWQTTGNIYTVMDQSMIKLICLKCMKYKCEKVLE